MIDLTETRDKLEQLFEQFGIEVKSIYVDHLGARIVTYSQPMYMPIQNLLEDFNVIRMELTKHRYFIINLTFDAYEKPTNTSITQA